MGGKSGAGFSRRGISGFVIGLWRTCDDLSGEKERTNSTSGALRDWEDGGGLMAVCIMFSMIRLLTYLLLRGGRGRVDVSIFA